jgi:peptide/nickel transport system substrate-binding protein
MDYRILGPLEVSDDDRPVAVGGEKQRALLAMLLLHAGEVVSADRLIDDLWGERSPAVALNALQVHVSRLRKALDSNGAGRAQTDEERDETPSGGVLVTRGRGYLLRVAPGELDLDRFQGMVEEGRQALARGDARRAAEMLRAGLAMWRGPPLADFTFDAFAQAPIAQLEELRLGAVEDRVEADLALGRHEQLVGELAALVKQNPLRERLRMQLMLAFYRCGRQAEALDVYQEYRRGLAEELGLDPSPRLQQLQTAVLASDPSLELPPDETAPAKDAAPISRRRRPAGNHRRLALGVLAIVGVAAAAVVALVSQGGNAAPLSVIAADSVGAISAARGAITAEALVGSSPLRVAVGQGSVWVTNYNDGTVSRIYPATHAVVPIQVGSTPTGIAVGADAVWVANSYSGTVSRIDPADDRVVGTITVGNGPSGVAVGDGSVWVANGSDGTLSRIDPGSDTARTIPLGGATDVAFGEGAVWVSDAADGRVLRVNPTRTGHRRDQCRHRSERDHRRLRLGVEHQQPRRDDLADQPPNQEGHGGSTGRQRPGRDRRRRGRGVGGQRVRRHRRARRPRDDSPARPITVGNSPRGLAVAGGLVWVSAQASLTSVPTSGPGLTQPTSPSGTKMPGGTVYFTEGPDSTPNYIFPMYSSTNCTTTNANQFMDMLYRPLYWYGNNYRPTVDYSYSIGQRPQFSDGDETVTIKLNSWKWSDGETVTSRDLVFWMNVLKASPATEWCGYAPGYFPDLVTSYSAPDPTTFVMRFNKAYNPEYVLYNVLSQLTPLPLAWDRTSLSQPAPTSDNGHLPDTTRAGGAAIYKFLDSEAKKRGRWTTSPLWKVVDGPFKLQSFTSTGEVTLVPNPTYSGAPKPTISKLVELPYATDGASYIALRSGGPSAVTVANIPSQYAPAIPTLTAEGYDFNRAASYSFSYFPLNFNSSATTSLGGEPVRYIFRQAYFREALQHLVDQQGWITAFFHGTANPTCGPIPLSPPSPLVNASVVSARPCAFSVAAARQLLSANGWNVAPGKTTTCVTPGTGAGECGAGINAGEGISFNVDYVLGVVSLQDEMKDLAAQARRVGINLSLSTHRSDAVYGALVPCTPKQATCKWQAENFQGAWIYGPGYLPTGETLFYPGASGNAGSYSDPKMTQLIQATVTGPAGSEATALTEYDKYAEQQLPVVFGPTQIGTYNENAGALVAKNLGGYAANALGFMNPEDWYFTK